MAGVAHLERLLKSVYDQVPLLAAMSLGRHLRKRSLRIASNCGEQSSLTPVAEIKNWALHCDWENKVFFQSLIDITTD